MHYENICIYIILCYINHAYIIETPLGYKYDLKYMDTHFYFVCVSVCVYKNIYKSKIYITRLLVKYKIEEVGPVVKASAWDLGSGPISSQTSYVMLGGGSLCFIWNTSHKEFNRINKFKNEKLKSIVIRAS